MTDDPRLDPRYDARLSELISQTADGIEPGEGLTAIRSRTRKETPMSNSRNWLFAVSGAVVGTAAVIVAIAVVSQLNDDDGQTPAASSSPSAPDTKGQVSDTPEPTQSATDTPTTADPTGQPVEAAVPVYYAGDGPRGVVLFREFQPGIGADPVAQAAQAAVAGPARDPEYRSLWPAGTQATGSYDGDVITVDITGANLHDRPAGMSERVADLAIQQVVYSVQGAAGARAGVQLLLDGQRTDQVLGTPASEPLTNAKGSDVLSQMSITTPEEGQKVSGSFTASGVNNAFEATFAWELRDSAGQVVANNFGTADGCCESDKLFGWTAEVDLTGVAPGTYTFVATNDDPSAGEGKGPDVDTRTVVVE